MHSLSCLASKNASGQDKKAYSLNLHNQAFSVGDTGRSCQFHQKAYFSWLGAACTVNISSNNASCSVSRDPDVNHDGAINILDLARIAISYGSKMGGPGYNVSYDLNADGKVTILDLALAAIEYQLPVFN